MITTVAGNGNYGFGGDNGPATSANLAYPRGVAVDSAGNLYIADTYNNRIRKVSGGTIVTLAGTAAGGLGGDNGPATSAKLAYPHSVAIDTAGNLYIADSNNSLVRKVSGGVITTVAGGGSSLGDNGPATSAQLNGAYGLAVGAGGSLYIAEGNNNRIRKVSGGVIATVAGGGTSLGDNGPATSAQLYSPEGVAVDSAGNLYIADNSNNRVREVSNGMISTVAGNGNLPDGGDNGPATNANLAAPWSVALDTAGNLYIAEVLGNRIRKVSNGVITTFAGNGTAGFSGDNGPATSAKLRAQAVAVDPAGNVYIADTLNNRIRKVSNGIITTVAGGGGLPLDFGGSAPATSIMLYQPNAVAADSAGNIYFTQSYYNVVNKVSNGVISTLAGNGKPGYSGDNGPATSALLGRPTGIAVDTVGNVYFADASGTRIRMLTPAPGPCTFPVSPTSLQAPAWGASLTLTLATASACNWTVTGLPDWITVSGSSSGSGAAILTLVAAANPGTARSANVSIGGTQVALTQADGTLPTVFAGGVVNAAGSTGAYVAPGSIATAYGYFSGVSLALAPGTPLPTSLGGVSMQIGGISAPLFAVSSGQVNFQVPWELAGQSQASLTVTVNGKTSAAQTVSIVPAAPGIFSMNSQGTGQGAILDTSYRLVDASNPAIAGSTVIQIFCTGLGAVSNPPPTGSLTPASPLSQTIATPFVSIDGIQAQVLFSGLAPGAVGEYQVDALVPSTLSNRPAAGVDIAISNGDSNLVTIAVK